VIKQLSKYIRKTEFIKVFIGVGSATFFKVLVGLIITKLIAVFTGTAGIALTSQLGSFLNISQVASTGGLSIGVTKYVAENNENTSKQQSYIKVAFTFLLCSSLFVFAILTLFSKFWSIFIFNTSTYSNIIIITGVFIPLYAINNYILAVLSGFKKYKLYTIISISNSFLGLFFAFGLVYFDNVRGALIATALFQSISAISTLFILRSNKSVRIEDFFDLGIEKGKLFSLLSFSTFTTVNLLCIPIAQLIIRSSIIKKYSIIDAGIWDGMLKISFGIIVLLNTVMVAYIVPKLSKSSDVNYIKEEIIKTSRLVLGAMFIVCLLVFSLKNYIIIFLYSESFLPMNDFFGYELGGDFFRLAGWLFACTLLAKAKITQMIVLELIFSLVLYVFLCYFFSNVFGIKGYYIAYLFNYIIYFIVMLIYFNHPSYGK
jgi:PST family polysaccharide transporter